MHYSQETPAFLKTLEGWIIACIQIGPSFFVINHTPHLYINYPQMNIIFSFVIFPSICKYMQQEKNVQMHHTEMLSFYIVFVHVLPMRFSLIQFPSICYQGSSYKLSDTSTSIKHRALLTLCALSFTVSTCVSLWEGSSLKPT